MAKRSPRRGGIAVKSQPKTALVSRGSCHGCGQTVSRARATGRAPRACSDTRRAWTVWATRKRGTPTWGSTPGGSWVPTPRRGGAGGVGAAAERIPVPLGRPLCTRACGRVILRSPPGPILVTLNSVSGLGCHPAYSAWHKLLFVVMYSPVIASEATGLPSAIGPGPSELRPETV